MPHAFTAPDAPGSSARTMIARLRPFLKSLALIVLLPLALLALGLWEVERGASSLADLKRSQAELPQALARLRAMAAQNPHAVVRFEGAKSAVTAELAVRQVEGWVQGLETDLLLAKARDVLAWATVAGSALLLAAGLAGLLLSAAARALGRLSRDRLVSAFAMLRRVLPILLGAQTAGFAVAIVSAGLFEAGGLWLADRVSVGEVKLLLSVILLGGVAIYAAVAAIRGLRRAFALFTPEPLDVLGRAVDETQAASLWRFTRELARRQEALEPDHVVVGLTEGFFVTSADVRLWPEERVLTGRTLYVPAPALALLNGREVAAIVGHELAHFSGEDTLYSQRFAPIYAGFERALAALSRNQAGNVFVLWPAIALGALTLYAFDTAVARWRREREFEADRRGSVVSGPDAAASALVRTAVAAPIIHAVLEGAADAPERADADLVAAVAAAAARGGSRHRKPIWTTGSRIRPTAIRRSASVSRPCRSRPIIRCWRGRRGPSATRSGPSRPPCSRIGRRYAVT
jgi:Zn-dependent protease with chaperone function